MDFTQILIAGALGAVGGGAGAALGLGVGKLFPEKSRQVITVILVVLGVALSQVANDKVKEYRVADQLRTEITANNELFAYIAKHFPIEYNATVQAISKNPRAKFAEAQGFALISSIRKDNAGLLWKAPIAGINDYLIASNDLHIIIRDQHGKNACSNFLIQGPPGIPEHMAARNSELENLGLMLFKVIVDGRENQTERTLTTNEDWENFFTAWLAADGTEEMKSAVISPANAGDELCNAWISMTDQLLTMNDAGADRIKAQIAHASAAS